MTHIHLIHKHDATCRTPSHLLILFPAQSIVYLYLVIYLISIHFDSIRSLKSAIYHKNRDKSAYKSYLILNLVDQGFSISYITRTQKAIDHLNIAFFLLNLLYESTIHSRLPHQHRSSDSDLRNLDHCIRLQGCRYNSNIDFGF